MPRQAELRMMKMVEEKENEKNIHSTMASVALTLHSKTQI